MHSPANFYHSKIIVMRSWVLLFVCITCLMGVCNDETKTRNTFIEYNLAGGICSGDYRIDVTENNALLEATALLIPASNGDPEVIILTFYDYSDNREVLFTIPVGNGVSNPIVLTYDSDFGMGILHQTNSCSITSGIENTLAGVNIDVKKFKRGGGGFGFQSVAELEVAFTGRMTDKNHPDGAFEYLIDGMFYYREQF